MYADQPQLLAQLVESTQAPMDPERARRLRGVLTQMSLRDEKVLFAVTRTGGPILSDLDPEPSLGDPAPRRCRRFH